MQSLLYRVTACNTLPKTYCKLYLTFDCCICSYHFKQNNNVLYLTGFNETDSVVVMEGNDTILFRKPEDEHQLVWEGPKTDEGTLKEHFGFTKVMDMPDLSGFIGNKKGHKLFVNSSGNDCIDVKSMLSNEPLDLNPVLHKLRSVKSKSEIELMKECCAVAANTFKKVMETPFEFEKDIETRFWSEMRLNGASGLSYVPVIAGGPRACIIHYTRNDQRLLQDELLLVDAGGMMNNYCSDITRTWPVGGKFSKGQMELYEAVLNVQSVILQIMQSEAKYSLLDLHSISYYAMIEELSRLGFNKPERCVESLYPHSIGHHLGMDLHDCPTVPFEQELRPGMVVTVEPGLYVPDSLEYPERFRGVGVRIEDDVAIEENGATVMTSAAPKDLQVIFKQ